jgi:hypothetical protein
MADLWPAACRCQGWRASDRGLRLRVLSEAVRRPLCSASDLDPTADFDRVKAHLGMLADNVQATIETDHPEIGQARRWRAAVRAKLRELREFHPDPDALLASLTRDKFGKALAVDELSPESTWRTDRRTGELQEGHSELEQVLFTLARIVTQKRKAARAEPGALAA